MKNYKEELLKEIELPIKDEEKYILRLIKRFKTFKKKVNKENKIIKERESSKVEAQTDFIKSDFVLIENIVEGIEYPLCLPCYNENTPGYPISYYDDIIWNGGTLITDKGEEIKIPSRFTAAIPVCWVEKLKRKEGVDTHVNWIYELDRVAFDKNKKSVKDIDKFLVVSPEGKFGIMSRNTKSLKDIKKSTISLGHDGNGCFRIKGQNTGSIPHILVEETYKKAGLSYLVPEDIYSKHKYFIKSPNLFPQQKLNPDKVILFRGAIYLNDTALHLAYYNEPERKDLPKSIRKEIQYLPVEQGEKVIEAYKEKCKSLSL